MKYLIITTLLLFALSGCSRETINGNSQSEKSNVTSSATISPRDKKTIETGNHLFNGNKIDTIEISGRNLLKRKNVELSIEMTSGKKAEFYIKRDDLGHGISMIFSCGILGVDLVYNLDKSVDEWCGAKDNFYYQMASYDFNDDGEKEIIIAGGNKKDILELYVFQFNPNLNCSSNNPKLLTTINGGYKSYVNDQDDICVIDSNDDISVYPYYESEEVRNEQLEKDEKEDEKLMKQSSVSRIDYPLIDIYFDKNKKYKIIVKEFGDNSKIYKEYTDTGDFFQYNKEKYSIVTVPSGRGITPEYILSVYEGNNCIKTIDCITIRTDFPTEK